MNAFWNWKSALLSALCRAAIFLAANLAAGLAAALAAMGIEFLFRTTVSGLLGNLTERSARLRLSAGATAAAVLGIASVGHLLEFVVHTAAGTPRLGTAMAGSIAFTLLSTAFNLYAMRRGVLITGPDRRTLLEDLRRLPGVLRDFILMLWASRRFI